MNKQHTSFGIAAKIWFYTAVISSLVISFAISADMNSFEVTIPILAFLAALVGSVPALMGIWLIISFIRKINIPVRKKFRWLFLSLFSVTIPYGLAAGAFNLLPRNVERFLGFDGFLFSALFISLALFMCAGLATFLILKSAWAHFDERKTPPRSYSSILFQLFNHTSKFQDKMDDHQNLPTFPVNQPNRILIKGLITGGLILAMLIPTFFIEGLIREREARQKEVVKEVSSKWASAQTVSGPFLYVPYNDSGVNGEGKQVLIKTRLLLLADNLDVTGKIIPEERPRSIYKVLLYKADIGISGSFKVRWPADINLANVDYANAKLCFSLSDFKGIEEEISVNVAGQKLVLGPGLPAEDFGPLGLSTPVTISPETLSAGIPFNMKVKLKGSEQLHFMPLASASSFQLSSAWPSPSFDGDMLPGERKVSDSGFTATWHFNQANLPFASVIRQNTVQGKTIDFGVSLVQPADQYNKTMRSVKYAILFIGLSFAFFFIIELMQKKPFHPVQYILVGLALVIFYTLLLSISEYILFDQAYLLASFPTITLITFYAKGHFNSWKTAAIFFVLLACLYGFIFVLIRLEDTALLVGSIGLFIVLALVMYVSRRINWYGNTTETIPAPQDQLA